MFHSLSLTGCEGMNYVSKWQQHPKHNVFRFCGDRPVCGERQVGVGAVQDLSGAGMKVDSEGEHYAQG